jgi:hypothetical protein
MFEHEPSTTGLSRVVLDPCSTRNWASRFAAYHVNHRERIQFDHVKIAKTTLPVHQVETSFVFHRLLEISQNQIPLGVEASPRQAQPELADRL